jgi:CheY-like chemotaxis protein
MPTTDRTLRVLVVDDDRDGADALGLLIEELGNQVHVTYGGTQALKVAAVFQPNLMLIDLAMPDMDGRGDHRIAVELGGPLLELREVLDALQGPLRTEQPLDVHAAQRGRIQAVAELLRANVSHQARGPVRVAVHVAVEC